RDTSTLIGGGAEHLDPGVRQEPHEDLALAFANMPRPQSDAAPMVGREWPGAPRCFLAQPLEDIDCPRVAKALPRQPGIARPQGIDKTEAQGIHAELSRKVVDVAFA